MWGFILANGIFVAVASRADPCNHPGSGLENVALKQERREEVLNALHVGEVRCAT